jgi:hypothetical protein
VSVRTVGRHEEAHVAHVALVARSTTRHFRFYPLSLTSPKYPSLGWVSCHPARRHAAARSRSLACSSRSRIAHALARPPPPHQLGRRAQSSIPDIRASARATYNASRVRVALLLRPYTAGDPDVPANDVFELRLNSNVILKRKSTLFLSMQGLLSKHHQTWHSGCDPESRYVLKDC